MPLEVIFPPRHSDWWVLGFDLIPYVDKIWISIMDYTRRKEQAENDSYHRTVWERLHALQEAGLLGTYEHDSKKHTEYSEKVRRTTDRIMRQATSDPGIMETLVSDLIAAYNNWLTYNLYKLYILDPLEDLEYIESILSNYRLWLEDLSLLKEKRVLAFDERPEILEKTAYREIEAVTKTYLLLEADSPIRDDYKPTPILSMQEYGHFIKYIKYSRYAPREWHEIEREATASITFDPVLRGILFSVEDHIIKFNYPQALLPFSTKERSLARRSIKSFMTLVSRLYDLYSSLRKLHKEYWTLLNALESEIIGETARQKAGLIKEIVKSIHTLKGDLTKESNKIRQELADELVDRDAAVLKKTRNVTEILQTVPIPLSPPLSWMAEIFIGALNMLTNKPEHATAAIHLIETIRESVPLSPRGLEFLLAYIKFLPGIDHKISMYHFWRTQA